MEENEISKKERRVLVAHIVQMAKLPRPVIDYCVKVLEVRDGFRSANGAAPEVERFESPTSEGLPAIDVGSCMQALEKILAVKPGKHPVLRDQLNGMRVLFNEGVFEDGAFFRQAVAGEYETLDRLALDRLLDNGLMRFVVHSAAKAVIAPYYRAAREGKRFDDWRRGQCPVCGSLPHFAYTDTDGEKAEKTLCCSLCGLQWQTDGGLCPFCGDDEPHAVRIESPAVENVWAEACPGSGFYLKAADRSAHFPSKDASLNDLASIRLDYTAMEEGFTRPGPIPC